jgi:hypothetical protein
LPTRTSLRSCSRSSGVSRTIYRLLIPQPPCREKRPDKRIKDFQIRCYTNSTLSL